MYLLHAFTAHACPGGLAVSCSPAEIVGSNPTRGNGCMSVVSVVCCQVEVSTTSWPLVQMSPTDCGASLCVLETSSTRSQTSINC